MRGLRDRTKQIGITLIEVLTSAVCLSFLAVAVTGSIRYVSIRAAYERQRLEINNILSSNLDLIKAYAANGALAPTNQVWKLPVPWQGLATTGLNVTLTESVVQTDPATCSVTLSASWEGDQPRSLSLRSQVATLKIPKVLATVTVDPKLAFTFNGTPTTTWLDLNALGVSSGSTITLRRLGSFNYGDVPPWFGMLALFSATSQLDRNATLVRRVPDAILAPAAQGSNFNYWLGTPGNDSLIQPGTFSVADLYNAAQDRITLVVPPGANYLAVEAADLWPGDNGQLTPNLQVEVSTPISNPAIIVSSGTRVIADSERDYGDQGFNGWCYGYYPNVFTPDPSNWSSFTLLQRAITPGVVTDPAYHTHDSYTVGGVNYGANGSTVINDQFCEGTNGAGTPDPTVGARRWVAPADFKNVSMQITVAQVSPGDDTTMMLLQALPGTNSPSVLWTDGFPKGTASGTIRSFSVTIGDVAAGTLFEYQVGHGGTPTSWDRLSWTVTGQ